MNLDDARVAQILGGIGHPTDFLFSRSREEMASQVSRLVHKRGPKSGTPSFEVRLSDEGNIVVEDSEESNNTIIVADQLVSVGLVRPTVGSLQDPSGLLMRMATLSAEIFRMRDVPAANLYGLKMSLAVPLLTPVADEVFLTSFSTGLEGVLSLLGNELDNQRLEWLIGFDRAGLHHSIYARTAEDDKAVIIDFDSRLKSVEDELGYADFVQSVVETVIPDLRRLTAPLLEHDQVDRDYLAKGKRE